jgi:hypothetical protein
MNHFLDLVIGSPIYNVLYLTPNYTMLTFYHLREFKAVIIMKIVDSSRRAAASLEL